MLTRYWIRFKSNEEHEGATILRYCGVTAFDFEDALKMIKRQVIYFDSPQDLVSVVENVDVSELDANHIPPNIGLTCCRGVWYPRLNVF